MHSVAEGSSSQGLEPVTATPRAGPSRQWWELLVAGGGAHANHGMDIRKRRRAKGKPTRTDKVLQVLLTGNRVASEEVVLEAASGIAVAQEEERRQSRGCRGEMGRRAQADRAPEASCRTKSGRQPA